MESEEEDVNSYWMTLSKRKNTANWKEITSSRSVNTRFEKAVDL
jgi:hypothetical protein